MLLSNMKNRIIILTAILLSGCRPLHLGVSYKMQVISTYNEFTSYAFKYKKSWIILRDSTGAYEFGDSIMIVKK